jgi:hypothetical protein
MVTVILVVSRFLIFLSSCEQKWLWRTIDDAYVSLCASSQLSESVLKVAGGWKPRLQTARSRPAATGFQPAQAGFAPFVAAISIARV